MKIEKISIDKIKLNPDNPRTIKDKMFKKLVKSVKSFKKMRNAKPIVIDENMMVLGGNMRLRACIEAGIKEIEYIQVLDWTEEEKKEFIIKDNLSFGEWDYELLSSQLDIDTLNGWGFDINMPTVENKEININDIELDKEKFQLKLNYKESDYIKVTETLSKISNSLEDALITVIDFYNHNNE
jgi:hypothetical protein